MFANTPLEELNVGCNKLTSIPAEVGSISTLKVLWAEALEHLADTEASNGLGWKQSKQNRSACSVEGQWA